MLSYRVLKERWRGGAWEPERDAKKKSPVGGNVGITVFGNFWKRSKVNNLEKVLRSVVRSIGGYGWGRERLGGSIIPMFEASRSKLKKVFKSLESRGKFGRERGEGGSGLNAAG